MIHSNLFHNKQEIKTLLLLTSDTVKICSCAISSLQNIENRKNNKPNSCFLKKMAVLLQFQNSSSTLIVHGFSLIHITASAAIRESLQAV